MPKDLLPRLRRAHAWLRRRASDLPGPAALSVETTVRCNLRCPMCPRTGQGYPMADMPEEILWPLLSEHAALGGDYVYLYGLGEPLMDPRIFAVLERCRALGLGTIVSTNGTFLDEGRRRSLLEVGCDHLIVSIDAVRDETYQTYRPGGRLREVEAGVEALAREKRAAGVRMDLVVQLVRLKGNRGEEEDFVQRWMGVPGVDSVRLKEEELGFEALGHVLADGYRRENPCHILWRGPLIVRWTGDVYPCHPFANGEAAVGSLRDHSLEALWRGPELTRLRQLHAEGRGAEVPRCAHCPITRPRAPVVVGAMALKGTTTQRLIPVAERLAARGRLAFAEGRLSSEPDPGAPSGGARPGGIPFGRG